MITNLCNFLLLFISFYFISGCSGPTIVIVKDRFEKETPIENPVVVAEKKVAPLPEKVKKFEPVKPPKIIAYDGPEYTIGIALFNNKTDLNLFGISEELSSQFSELSLLIGLEPFLLSTPDEEKEIMLELKISGSVTSYKESANESEPKEAFIEVTCLVEDILTGRVILNRNISGKYTAPGISTSQPNAPEKNQPLSLRKGAIGNLMKNLKEPLIEALNNTGFQGRVVAVDREKVFFRAGARSKLKPGTLFEVYPPDIKNENIGKKKFTNGEMILQSHQTEKISEGTKTSGSKFETGSIVVPVVK